MSEERKVRRFSKFAILFHWAVGLPYMVLLVSGGLIMLQRMGLLQWRGGRAVESLHLWIGVGLSIVIVQGAFAAIISGNLGAIREDLADWIVMRPRDILWLLKLPFNVFWPARFPLPPVGRYNAGQKIHGLFIFIALIVFAITGIYMILMPADLRPWIVHSWFFYAGAGFLTLHLFLGVINRATRPALSGILTGYVPRDYVKHHHPLELKDAPDPSPHAVVSWRALAGTWAIAILLAGSLLHWYGPERVAEQVLRIQGQEHAAISPGELFAAHADDRRMTSCQTCHQSLAQPPNAACLTCHTNIQTVMEQQLGFHGKLEGSCRDCHADHRGRDAKLIAFEPTAFNHQLAQFSLQGKHQTLRCDQCHLDHSPKSGEHHFIGVSFSSCVDCHNDPHEPSIGNDCRRCHSAEGWTGRQLLFDHNRDASFKIDAVHSGVSCIACHQDANGVTSFRLETTSCESCHTSIVNAVAGKMNGALLAPDPHSGRVKCADCHTPEVNSPTPAQFANHCLECHSSRYRGLYFDWQRSIEDRAQIAEAVIKQIQSKDPARAESLKHQLDLARQVGMHNVQRAVEMISEIGNASIPSK